MGRLGIRAVRPPRRRRKFNRWLGLVLAFVIWPLLTVAVASGYIDGALRQGPYATEPRDLRQGVVVSSQYHSGKYSSTCDVVLAGDRGKVATTLAETYCFRQIARGDHVTFRVWRGDVTDVWNGSYHLWTKRNPNEEVFEWLPLTLLFVVLMLALMVWAIVNFVRNRPPPRQLDRPIS